LACRADHHLVRVVDVVVGLAAVQIVTADLAEKNLALHAKARSWIAGGAVRGPMSRATICSCLLRLELADRAAAVRHHDVEGKALAPIIRCHRVRDGGC